jgi:divalent metal cation (Fe/Co/Zn/Cd) transporter
MISRKLEDAAFIGVVLYSLLICWHLIVGVIQLSFVLLVELSKTLASFLAAVTWYVMTSRNEQKGRS